MSEHHPSHEWETYAGRIQCRRCGVALDNPSSRQSCPGAASAEYPSASWEADWQHKNRRFKAACAALTGLLACPLADLPPDMDTGITGIAREAVAYADALLEALKETK